MIAKKILVVEDDKVSQQILVNLLKSAGYQVVTAGDAVTAVQTARTEDPDLITLDINLAIQSPDNAWDGFTVASWLRRISGGTSRPAIVVISGVDPSKVIAKASEVGAYTFLPKPIEKQKLLDVVAEALK